MVPWALPDGAGWNGMLDKNPGIRSREKEEMVRTFSKQGSQLLYIEDARPSGMLELACTGVWKLTAVFAEIL